MSTSAHTFDWKIATNVRDGNFLYEPRSNRISGGSNGESVKTYAVGNEKRNLDLFYIIYTHLHISVYKNCNTI